MSHIPNSAMPHAGPDFEGAPEEGDAPSKFADRAGRAAEIARENPKTSIAAGAAMLVGAIAAAAFPFFRSRNKDKAGTSARADGGSSRSNSGNRPASRAQPSSKSARPAARAKTAAKSSAGTKAATRSGSAKATSVGKTAGGKAKTAGTRGVPKSSTRSSSSRARKSSGGPASAGPSKTK